MVTPERQYGLRELRDLSPRAFEFLLADIWQERQGWETEVMDKGRDGGVDVVGRPPGGGPATALQAKCNAATNAVSRPEVQQYAALPQEYKGIGAVTVVTTSRFTDPALAAADRLDVKTIDGATLLELIDAYDAEEIVAWYCNGRPPEGV